MSGAPLDGTRPVRAGEELETSRLRDYLRSLGLDGEVAVEQFPSGHSNLTYLVRAGDRELVLRRPPFGSKVKTAHDMGREYKILSRITTSYPAPRPIAYCEDASVLGAPFYLMERVRGTIVRLDPPPALRDDPAAVGRLCRAFVDTLARLHTLDYAAVGLGDLGKPEGYVERQVTGWTKRYHDAKTDDIAEMEWLAAWLHERTPRESGAALIHNDFKYDNVILDSNDLGRVVGVLDWEMSTVGDPLMDLGTALGYWVQAGDPDELQMVRFCATTLPGSWTRAELAARYFEAVGRAPVDLLFYYCFALFKTAGVAQQIYYRWKQGLTKDDRFQRMIFGVRILSSTAKRAAERGRI